MHEVVTETEINASPSTVWSVLMDFAHYPGWNPFVRQLSGEAVPGHRLTVSICPPGGKAMTFRPKTLVAEPNTELRWLGRMLMPVLYELNINLAQMFSLPFLSISKREVLPFIATPFLFVGLSLTTTWKALLSLSCIGGSCLANAAFRTRWRALRHAFVERERGPRFLRSAVGKPLPDPYPKHSVVSRIMIVAASIVLGYSFIGLGAFLLFFMFGIHAYCRDLLYTCAIALSKAFWVADRLVRPYDKPNDYRH